MDDRRSLATGVRPSQVTSAFRRVGALPLRFLALLTGSRRQFNLPRWTRGREFRDLHSTAVAWLESHFELIEGAAPWLHRAGRQVRDTCSGQVKGLALDLTPHFKASVSCAREVTAVYGFDGPLTARLRSLDQAIPAAGWELPARQTWQDFDSGTAATTPGLAEFRTRWVTDRQVVLTWRPTAALGLPAGGERMRPRAHPPLAPSMRVTWSSRGQPPGWLGDPNEAKDTTRNYLPLEVSEPGVQELLEQALVRSEHVLTVTIELSYYSNPDARAWRQRIPRYILQPGAITSDKPPLGAGGLGGQQYMPGPQHVDGTF